MLDWFLSFFVTGTLEMVLGKMTVLGTNAYGSVSNVDGKLETLGRTLTRVQSVMNDKHRIRAWEDLAYDADDFTDEIAIAVSKLERGDCNQNPVNKFLFSFSKRSAGPNLNYIQTQLNDVLDSIQRHYLIEQADHSRRSVDTDTSLRLRTMMQTTSLMDEAHVIGREEDKSKLMKMLLGEDESSSRRTNVCIIPIVGMFGIGKTTLAQLVYNYGYEATEADAFDLKMWVSVTKDFDIMRLTRSIIEATKCGNFHHLDLELLQLQLKEILRNKKFLLVLDHLCNEKPDELDLLLRPLEYGLKGSKIIVTTTSLQVSSLIGTVEPYHLKCLSDHNCWLLLKDQAFGDIRIDVDPKLEAIGKNIARKCKGFPLAAKSLGRILRRKINEAVWNEILETNICSTFSDVAEALRLSFCEHLPSHLKQCFAYCSIFPENYGFEKDKLVRMWMAEGFIIPGQESRTMEDLASGYFQQLFSMTIFHAEAEKYKMNQTVHDLAPTVCGEKFLRMEDTDSSINTNARHLSLVCKGMMHTQTFEASFKCKGLRSFLLFSNCETIIQELPVAMFLKLGRLRVLDLSSTRIEELAKSIGNLKHLRFLDLSNTFLQRLPETTQELCLLQTVRLVNCVELLDLPKGLGKLKNLRHLELCGDNQLISMPSGIGKLTALQTMSQFVIGSQSGQLKELKDMNNIRGSLCIKQLEKVSNPEEAIDAKLASKKHLDELELQWTSVVDARNDEYVLDKLMDCPHERLRTLTVRRYGGRMLPKWVSNPLFAKLGNIIFDECTNCSLLPPLGQLPNLKSLRIEGMHELQKVDEDFCGESAGFPALERLEFRDMPKLESWVGLGDEDMTCLCELIIAECPQMVILPSLHHLRSLEKFELECCPQLPSLPKEGLSSSIRYLVITECPLLEERCKGDDWKKIEHIPDIEIDYDKVRESEA